MLCDYYLNPNFKVPMKKKESIHEKAIRLLEGGVVDVGGHSVRVKKTPNYFDACYYCEMDCLCHSGTEMELVCKECDSITQRNCILVLVTSSSNRP